MINDPTPVSGQPEPRASAPYQAAERDEGREFDSHQFEHGIGEQYDHVDEPSLRDLPLNLWNIPRLILLGMIRLYQMTFSRLLPSNTCRFYPSCSHYGYQAIYKYGVIKGSWMATWRVVRCNPFSKGGFDPVP